jgi:hypothetical protein
MQNKIQTHNPAIEGSGPTPAVLLSKGTFLVPFLLFWLRTQIATRNLLGGERTRLFRVGQAAQDWMNVTLAFDSRRKG